MRRFGRERDYTTTFSFSRRRERIADTPANADGIVRKSNAMLPFLRINRCFAR